MSSSKKEDASLAKMCHITNSSMAIMEFEGLGREYYEDDSDKEFDIPIDPIWESQQISTFTAWCNAHLRKANMRIDSFENDFRSGLKLMKLLEIISNDKLPPPDKGRMRLHKIANVNKSLKFIEEKGVKLASIGAEEIVDGNVKMTLGMIWTIILRFSIQNILVEESSAKEGLLLWCKRKTVGYKNIEVENFKTSFQNGLAFCAIIHSHDQSLIDYDSLSPNHKSDNLKLAFSVAEKHLDVPQMLNADDMSNNKESDERSIMTYVSTYYHAIEQKDKLNSALNNICKIISTEMNANETAYDYEQMAKDILRWIEARIVEFQDRCSIDEAKTLNCKLNKFKDYKFVDHPEQTKEKIYLQIMKLRNSSTKENNQYFSIIHSKWLEMEKLEKCYEEYLSDQRHRNDLIKNLVDKFEINFQVQRAWISDKIDLLMSKDYETCNLYELKKLFRSQETFKYSFGANKSRTDKIIDISHELRRLKYKDMESIDKKVDMIVGPWESLTHLNNQKTEKIKVFLNALIEIDDLQLEFAKRVIPLYNWTQQAIQDLNDSFSYHLIEEIKDLIKAQETFKSTVHEALDELRYTNCINDRICKIITLTGLQKIPVNQYTNIIIQDLHKAWAELESSISERDKCLQNVLFKELSLKDCKENFESLCRRISEYLLNIQNSLIDFVSSPENITKNKSKLQLLQGNLLNCIPQLKEAEAMNKKIGEDSCFNKLKARYSFEQLKAIYEILDYLMNEVSRSSTMKNTTSDQHDNLSSRRIEEYKACFKHFDRANSNYLDPKQFRACMISLGYTLSEDEQNDQEFNNILMRVDPEKTGFITLKSFLDFMTKKNHNIEESDLLVESFRILANNQNSINRDTIIKQLPEPIAEYCLDNMPVKSTSDGDNECFLDYHTFSSKIFDHQSSRQNNESGY